MSCGVSRPWGHTSPQPWFGGPSTGTRQVAVSVKEAEEGNSPKRGPVKTRRHRKVSKWTSGQMPPCPRHGACSPPGRRQQSTRAWVSWGPWGSDLHQGQVSSKMPFGSSRTCVIGHMPPSMHLLLPPSPAFQTELAAEFPVMQNEVLAAKHPLGLGSNRHLHGATPGAHHAPSWRQSPPPQPTVLCVIGIRLGHSQHQCPRSPPKRSGDTSGHGSQAGRPGALHDAGAGADGRVDGGTSVGGRETASPLGR